MNDQILLPQQFTELPALLPFLPMLYVAWADAVLTPAEIELIGVKIEAQTWLKISEKRILKQWLDPANPPSPRELKEWLRIIKKSAAEINIHSKQTLANLGIDIARLNGFGESISACSDSEANRALCQIEEALGVVSREAFDEMVGVPANRPSSPKASEQKTEALDAEKLQKILDGEFQGLRNKVRKVLEDPSFALTVEQDKATFREQTLKWSQLLAAQGWGAIAYPEKYGGKGDISKYMAVF